MRDEKDGGINMNMLTPRSPLADVSATSTKPSMAAMSSTKLRAIQDAQQMQEALTTVQSRGSRSGTGHETFPFPYTLQELIGKGSFGRVYRAVDFSGADVALKIMSIEEADSFSLGQGRGAGAGAGANRGPGPCANRDPVPCAGVGVGVSKRSNTCTAREILNELATLRILSESHAPKINKIVDCLLVGTCVVIATEFCAGGSVGTLIRPWGTGIPSHKEEKYLVPVLREVAKAVEWIHEMGVIHRDIKCANVLVTEEGEVQLCDFGVAAVLHAGVGGSRPSSASASGSGSGESGSGSGVPGIKRGEEKRSTITGTLRWMAPELFEKEVKYGREVDVWGFGSMAYEAATGLPPNAELENKELEEFGEYLRQNAPRLEGDGFSEGLKALVAFCMVPDPMERPTASEVRRHGYIADTEEKWPTRMLVDLVAEYREWEREGGARRSLFSAGGAQAGLGEETTDPILGDGWDYTTAPDQSIFESVTKNVDTTTQPMGQQQQNMGQRRVSSRRRLPPENLRVHTAPKTPLEKAFDPHTMSNYREHARDFYRFNASPSCVDRGIPTPGPESRHGQESGFDDNTDTNGGVTIRESPVNIKTRPPSLGFASQSSSSCPSSSHSSSCSSSSFCPSASLSSSLSSYPSYLDSSHACDNTDGDRDTDPDKTPMPPAYTSATCAGVRTTATTNWNDSAENISAHAANSHRQDDVNPTTHRTQDWTFPCMTSAAAAPAGSAPYTPPEWCTEEEVLSSGGLYVMNYAQGTNSNSNSNVGGDGDGHVRLGMEMERWVEMGTGTGTGKKPFRIPMPRRGLVARDSDSAVSLIDLDKSVPTPLREAEQREAALSGQAPTDIGLGMVTGMDMEASGMGPHRFGKSRARSTSTGMGMRTSASGTGSDTISPFTLDMPGTCMHPNRTGNAFEAAFGEALPETWHGEEEQQPLLDEGVDISTDWPSGSESESGTGRRGYSAPSLRLPSREDDGDDDGDVIVVGNDPDEEIMPPLSRFLLNSRSRSDGLVGLGIYCHDEEEEEPVMFPSPRMPPPSAEELVWESGKKDRTKEELKRMLLSMKEHLQYTGQTMQGVRVRRRKN